MSRRLKRGTSLMGYSHLTYGISIGWGGGSQGTAVLELGAGLRGEENEIGMPL